MTVTVAHCRWLGPLRFTYGALQQILLRKSWSIRMAYYPAELPSPQPPGKTCAMRLGRPDVVLATCMPKYCRISQRPAQLCAVHLHK